MAYAALHGSIGMAIVKIIPNPWISLPIAFASHLVVDFYPEASVFTNKKGSVILFWVEIALNAFVTAFFVKDFLNGNWLPFVGFLAGNLMDIIDSIIYLSTKREFWCCHPRGGWFPFPHSWWESFPLPVHANIALDIIIVVLLTLK